VRECHGDMHLANMVALGNEVVIFDCIEFNPALRWIDVMSELAFLAMDLDDRGAPGFSYRAVNRYLEETGDYAGLAVFGLYRVYRAMVRAKVAGIRLGQGTLDDRERRDLEAECGGYLDLAERYTRGETPGLVITHGLSGSGKTTVSQDALEHLGAIRVRSDVERKRLAGMAPAQRSDAGLSEGLYSADATHATYDRLAELANLITGAGFTAIVDAAFLQTWQRRLMAELAERQGLPLLVLDVEASEAELRRRVRERAAANTDASDAGIQVLEQQLGHRDPLGTDLPRVRVRSGEPLPIAEIREHLER